MNAFDNKLYEAGCYPLKAEKISILLILLTYRCNLRCTHCYLDASPDQTEDMTLETIDRILNVIENNSRVTTLELSGGEPELNPHFRYFVKSATALGKKLTLASNLTLFNEPGMEDLPDFLAENRVKIFGSLPYYKKEIMEQQRGKGIYDKVISSLKRLNQVGYGQEGLPLELDIEFNPPRTDFAPDHRTLEKMYKENLLEMHGIKFNNLVVLNNAPLGRTRKQLSDEGLNEYMKKLEGAFTPDTVKSGNLMCKYSVCLSPNGDIWDCAFFEKLDIPLKTGKTGIDGFDYESLSKREIMTNPICFYCTANAGVTCYQFDEMN